MCVQIFVTFRNLIFKLIILELIFFCVQTILFFLQKKTAYLQFVCLYDVRDFNMICSEVFHERDISKMPFQIYCFE